MIGYIIFAAFVGFSFSLPVVIWSLMNLEGKIQDKTIELEEEIENLKTERYERADKDAQTREDLAKTQIELDRLKLKLKYEKLLEERTK